MACAITAKKNGIDVGHVEAGIRSGDMKMPEEINRIVTDAITDHFFTTTPEASQYLQSMYAYKKIHFVGNTMIDCLIQNIHKIKKPAFLDDKNKKQYYLLTLHRPSNVDDSIKLTYLLKQIKKLILIDMVIFPVHPRTRAKLDNHINTTPDFLMVDPIGYHEFLYLIKNAKGVITDSGGITEEATFLHIPCLTLRKNTERPETIRLGTNVLIGHDMQKLKNCIETIDQHKWKKGKIPPFWDGKTSERIVEILYKKYKNKEIDEYAH
jgi:UDP-N-acetylglucosamine 2-epimerase (non-hydrolysing)